MQYLATIFCSIAVVLLTVALFRPVLGEGFGAEPLGAGACVLMGLFVIFQDVAFILATVMERTYFNGRCFTRDNRSFIRSFVQLTSKSEI